MKLETEKPLFVQTPKAPSFRYASRPGEAVSVQEEPQGSHAHPLTSSFPSGIVNVFPSRQESFEEIRESRRKLWQETGYVPPITGGSPDTSKIGDDIPDSESARRRMIETVDPDQHRIAKAQELGLPDNASWGEIFTFLDEQERAGIATELGLSPYPAAKKYGLSEYPSWRRILTKVLGLPGTASAEDMIEKVRETRKSSES